MHEKNVIDAIILNIKNHDYLKTAITKTLLYPWQTGLITQPNLPIAMFKLGDVIILGKGKAQFDYNYNTLIIMIYRQGNDYSNILDQLIELLVNVLYSIPCIRDVGLITILTGDIGLFNLPSDTGYNTDYMVRKIFLNYTINKVITPIILPILLEELLKQ